MGDSLAKLLYQTIVDHQANAGLTFKPFDELTPAYQQAWAEAAKNAEERIRRECLDDVERLMGEFGEAAGAAMLEECWFGKREVER